MELNQDGLCEPSICPVNNSTIQTLKSAVVDSSSGSPDRTRTHKPLVRNPTILAPIGHQFLGLVSQENARDVVPHTSELTVMLLKNY